MLSFFGDDQGADGGLEFEDAGDASQAGSASTRQRADAIPSDRSVNWVLSWSRRRPEDVMRHLEAEQWNADERTKKLKNEVDKLKVDIADLPKRVRCLAKLRDTDIECRGDMKGICSCVCMY